MPKVGAKGGAGAAGGGKPPFRVPGMAEVAALRWNGLTVASTFSGCGGSCLGYRMAGFRVRWANEFVPAAQESYLANCAEGSFLDRRDVKLVQPGEVLRQLGIGEGDLDLFDGSPPCQAFSTAGKRHKGWGQVKRYEGGHEQLNETLFDHWLRLLRGLAPKTFVAENVSGLVKGTAKGVFLEVLAAMKSAGYRVSARVLDAQWLGVPQVRQRVIFVGVREDLAAKRGGAPLQPCHPDPLPHRYSVADALPWIMMGTPSGTIQAGAGKRTSSSFGHGTCLVPEGVRIIKQQGAPGVGKKPVSPGGPLPTVLSSQAQQFVLYGAPVEPESSMDGLATGDAWDEMTAAGDGKSGRYFQLVKAAPGEPCPSITAAGGNAGLASACHPTERRKFSIAELRRLCAFPDDFVLAGSYAQQWERLGNSVPPVMMFWIARTVRDRVLLPAAGRKPWAGDPPCLLAGSSAAGGG